MRWKCLFAEFLAPDNLRSPNKESQGVICGIEMCEVLAGMGAEIRARIHAGEIEVHDDGDISGIAVNLAARAEQQAAVGELWTSSTERDLMLGGAFDVLVFGPGSLLAEGGSITGD